jgi:GntR family transcriptional repressor for pyruvate dehydrogenase complex
MTDESSPKLLEPLGRGSLVDDIIERLTSLIIEGGLRPGDQLFTERELMTRLGVGRSSLREAIKTLSALGILDIRHGTGTFISSGGTSMLTRPLKWGLFLTQTSVRDVIDARASMEISMARWAAERATEAEIADIAKLLKHLEESQGDAQRYVEYDLAFHMAIARASHNELFLSVLTMLQHILRVWMETTFAERSVSNNSMKLHRRIFAAIKARDPEAAAQAMAIHTTGGPLLAAAERAYPGKMTPISAIAYPEKSSA